MGEKWANSERSVSWYMADVQPIAVEESKIVCKRHAQCLPKYRQGMSQAAEGRLTMARSDNFSRGSRGGARSFHGSG